MITLYLTLATVCFLLSKPNRHISWLICNRLLRTYVFTKQERRVAFFKTFLALALRWALKLGWNCTIWGHFLDTLKPLKWPRSLTQKTLKNAPVWQRECLPYLVNHFSDFLPPEQSWARARARVHTSPSPSPSPSSQCTRIFPSLPKLHSKDHRAQSSTAVYRCVYM